MFFWHRNKKFSERELCNFSINWQEGIFLPARKYRSIYLHIRKKIYSLSISQPNKLHPTIWQYCYTPSLLGFISNVAHWLHAGALAVLTCNCCHSLAARLLPHLALQHRTGCLCTTCRGRQQVRNLVESVYVVFCRQLIVSLIFCSLEPQWTVLLLLRLN